MRIRGAVALVTGASSGIGWATALRLAELGARVILTGRDTNKLAVLATMTGGTPLAADLSDPAAVSHLATAALDAAGRVDLLVNNAGEGYAGRVTSMAAGQVARLVATNLVAPIELTRMLLPGMVSRGTGTVAFVSSIAGRTGVAGEAVYAATKAGVDTFAESLRLELADTGVRVGVLVPGVVRTAFFERRGEPYQRRTPRPLPAARVADVLVRAIATDHPERYAPAWLRLPVAVRALAPTTYRRLAGRFGGA
ncbi:SDR family NAD(P)-dependent oxidoreductase [Actinocatenispora rupis]|uniref:Oxidoreductase n=1 Tax=Actinocatenispora rupis TaxID=519421 RepID=A0A8J3NEJ1_9ACTN|nr:SDR family NAD(P)-dependent oxidoreductase [Actinocatenispora rupis]GID16399.1 oxidoreductase [Actinocatenispora rupis]